MLSTMTANPDSDRSGGALMVRPPTERLRGWLKLLVGLGLLWLVVFVLAPALQGLPGVRTLAEYIRSSGISAGALYYTEVEEVGESETSVRDTFRFMPRRE